jgi:uncharacterized protein (TIGR02246 family)
VVGHSRKSKQPSIELVQQIEAINQKFDEAFNKHDAAAVGALYTANAVQSTPQGSFSGREAIEGYMTDLFQRHNPTDRVTKMSYVYAFGGDICALGGWAVTIDSTKNVWTRTASQFFTTPLQVAPRQFRSSWKSHLER